MKTLTKTLVGTAAVLAVAVGSAVPAAAQDRQRDRGGLSTGEVIAGALIIGGIAAVAASASNNRDRYDDRNYRGNNSGWYDYNSNRRNNRNNNADRAVQQCVRAAERQAERWGGGRADVTQIRDVERERNGFEVRGTIAVRTYNNRGGNWNNYRRGYRNNGFEEGRFTCDFRRGQVRNVDFRGLRGL
ncbi:hypothetical protein M3P36_11820 [Altererythrobacter sp. KTW20L]|uniref:hypothetical protein n=1 Tax=Altererythrobacter sp. KTW20L TaxID=2942210 RepID=UPI0020BE0E63|nr:hypothetical protein [Altererythrobacter sp. KTW20L]MCL6251724.1 hypothetical protein [Altererythrobacter sp. KTW20L]